MNCCIDTIKSLFVIYVNFKEFFEMQKMENVAKRLKMHRKLSNQTTF